MQTQEDQRVDVVGVGDAGQLRREQFGDLLPGLVDRRQDDVRRRFAGQLDDVLAKGKAVFDAQWVTFCDALGYAPGEIDALYARHAVA